MSRFFPKFSLDTSIQLFSRVSLEKFPKNLGFHHFIAKRNFMTFRRSDYPVSDWPNIDDDVTFQLDNMEKNWKCIFTKRDFLRRNEEKSWEKKTWENSVLCIQGIFQPFWSDWKSRSFWYSRKYFWWSKSSFRSIRLLVIELLESFRTRYTSLYLSKDLLAF